MNMLHKLKNHVGLLLIISGVLLLALTRIDTLSSSNTLLLTGLLCNVVGIVLHIKSIKHESQY